MKLKLLFSLIAFMFLSFTASYASFPVQKTANATTTVSAETNKKEELTSPALASGEKSQLVALILCLAVGGIGIHRFYLGYTWQGVVQLLTLGGCGVWSLIDLVRIITGDLEPKDSSYDKTL